MRTVSQFSDYPKAHNDQPLEAGTGRRHFNAIKYESSGLGAFYGKYLALGAAVIAFSKRAANALKTSSCFCVKFSP